MSLKRKFQASGESESMQSFEFIALKGKGSDCEARQAQSGWILELKNVDKLKVSVLYKSELAF